MPRLAPFLSSLSGKVFAAFLVVLATFGATSAFDALTMRRLGDEVRRVAGDYLTLRLELHDLQTRQLNLVQFVERADEETARSFGAAPPGGFVKSAIDAARRYRKADVRKVAALARAMLDGTRDPDEIGFLRMFGERLGAVESTFEGDEALFDHVFGPPGTKPLVVGVADPRVDATARQRLLARENDLHKDLGALMNALRGREQRAEEQLERDERRAVWASVILALLAASVGVSVLWLTQRAIRPLRRLAASAKEVARGDYRQRVDVQKGDEIGVLAGEFNAMAAALEERELRLIRSERLAAVGKIAAQITHEIRNPLSSIGLNAEMLEEELSTSPNPSLPKLARAIVTEVDRLAEITEQYLKFARLPRPRLEPEDVNAIVSSLLSFSREELAKRGVAVEHALAPSLPRVAADENQLRQALLNLIRNAGDAMRAGGRLSVATSVEGGFVRVRIEDTGTGIAADDLPKIFDPFFTTKAGGTGLGLALTQQILVEHGGGIDVRSEVGRGTCFTLRLPALARVEPERARPPGEPTASEPTPRFVDEEPDGAAALPPAPPRC